MDNCAIKFSQIKIARCPSSENEAILFLVPHMVKQAEPLDFVLRLIQLLLSALEEVCLVDLAVVLPLECLDVDLIASYCTHVAAYAVGISAMGLFNVISYTAVLRDVSIGHGNLWIKFLKTVVYIPSHDAHEACISVRFVWN